MKELRYVGKTILVDDEIGEAVIGLSRALARGGSSDSVTVPGVVNGVQGDVELLLGPSSELFLAPVEDSSPTPRTDAAVVAELRKRADGYGPSRPVPEQAEPDGLDYEV
jgi:hypothetical protein